MPLITVDALAARLDDPDLRLCDVRWYLTDPGRGRREYEAAHLPGAVFVDLEADLTGPTGPGRHPLPSPGRFATRMGELGVGRHHTVVVYDDGGGGVAARLWWMLRGIGVASVFVLDGGLSAWRAAALPLTTEVPRPSPVDLPAPPTWPGVVDRSFVSARLGSFDLIDARASERYRGEVEPVDPLAGHIPTAVNLPYTENLDETGRFRAPAELAARYAGLGAGRPIVAYCGSGVTACHAILALELAGVSGVLLYEGSWSDWSSVEGAPVAVGPDPGTV